MVKNSVRLHAKFIAIVCVAIVAFVGQSLVMAQTPTAEVEIVGTVSALTTQTLTIGTQSFDISHAEIKAGVVVGALVKIHAAPGSAGLWIAREVELAQVTTTQTPSPEITAEATAETTQQPAPQGEFEITGQITALTATTIVVGGQMIDISAAEIKNPLTLNQRVKVHVTIVDGVWIAREVDAASTPVTGTFTVTLQGNDGQDDGPGHDVNDDHGNHIGGDDNGQHSGSDDNQGNNNDNHGGNNSSSDDGNSGHGGNGSGGHGHG